MFTLVDIWCDEAFEVLQSCLSLISHAGACHACRWRGTLTPAFIICELHTGFALDEEAVLDWQEQDSGGV